MQWYVWQKVSIEFIHKGTWDTLTYHLYLGEGSSTILLIANYQKFAWTDYLF